MDPEAVMDINEAGPPTADQRSAQSQLQYEARAIENEMDMAVQYDFTNRERNRQNWRMYAAIDFGQYSASELAQAAAEGRHVDTYNIVTQKIDSLAGAILRNPFDMDFIPVEPSDAGFTKALKQAMLSDKEMMDWDTSYHDLVIGGLIYESVEEMYIDRRFHKLGNIAWRVNLPGHVIFDPNWKTSSGKDLLKCWKVSYLSSTQIVQLWPKTRPYLQPEIDRLRVTGGQDIDPLSKGITPNFELYDTGGFGNKHRVIQFYEMVKEEYWQEYEKTTGMDLPQTDDLAYKMAWLNKNCPKWDETTLKQRKEHRNVCYCTVIIPEVLPNVIIEKKPTEVQIGRLPFFPWSAARINGVPRGIVDLIRDIQRNINHREMLVSFIIQTNAMGGEVLDPLLFNNRQTEIDEYIATKNQPNKTFIAAPGAAGRNLMPQKLRQTDLPQDVTAQLIRMWDYADRISKAPAAYDARGETQSESGYAFAQKVRQAEQQQYILFSGLKRHLNEKGDAYLAQAKIQYALGGYQRDFAVPGKDKFVSFNQHTEDADGNISIANDINQLPRHKVIISESPDGITNRLITRAVSAEALQAVPTECVGTRTKLASTIVSSMDNFSDEDKAELEELNELEIEQAKSTLKFNIMQNNVNTLNLQMQAQQLQAQAAAPQAAIGGPAPAPGGGSAAGPEMPAEGQPAPAGEAPTPGVVPEAPQAVQAGPGPAPAPTAGEMMSAFKGGGGMLATT